MSRTAKRLLSTLAAITLLIAGGLYYLLRPAPEASLARRPLTSGGELVLATPGDKVQHRVLLALPAEQQLNDAELLELAKSNHAEIGQYPISPLSCEAQSKRQSEAAAQLDGPIELFAGSEAGAMLAWRWLAAQNDDQAQALSVGFALYQADCPETAPTSSAHGHWLAAWNDNPDDASARFVREAKAQTLIGD